MRTMDMILPCGFNLCFLLGFESKLFLNFLTKERRHAESLQHDLIDAFFLFRCHDPAGEIEFELQIIRILKNYGFLKEPQLELFKPKKRKNK